ncbi:diablo IAP-binding mitochondrial protein-like [Ptychodera flava]|uniref:diablo IAP-binding mitochondrial protein-like n=1 Tax=Ptychodera flava TaxID=63121 RepID=UPI00396A44BC
MSRNLFRTILTVTSNIKETLYQNRSRCRAYFNSRKFWSLMTVGTGVSICAQVVKPVDEKDQDKPKLPTVDPSTLTNATLIRNAASLTVDSASTLLSQTVLALNDALEDYARGMYTTVKLMEHEMQVLGDEASQDKVWQLIIKSKSDLEERKLAVEQLESMFHFAVKVMESASVAAFQSGCDIAAMAAGERIHQAEMQIENARKIVQQAKDKLTTTQAQSVEATTKHAEESEDKET